MVFEYWNSLGRDYDNVIRNIRSITFPISRYGKYTKTIKFNRFVTEKYAITQAEKWLSLPITYRYLKNRDDDFLDDPYQYINQPRGRLLSSLIFLDRVRKDTPDGDFTLLLGS
jgi:hypothetical protein